ncbi:M14 family metallopeptidase [Comamonas endophytica]|uniref:M14 family metallopeptidase n=1 Tax=Comamonas endophytica TaxID=2949090 RepID=A0ABY6GCE3_9BURK|nr:MULTISPECIES: M14 family metallopeptidase [unclassified Acidovorax]MCD2512201.1 M14 family metallopeptidase [Acidovorax sp. D4N7]UYG51970.1 M14 family metallopeptidase [Acidovorax sp. 5MLIR]
MQPHPAFSGRSNGAPQFGWTLRLSAIAMAALLAACSSTPLPPWPGTAIGSHVPARAPVPSPVPAPIASPTITPVPEQSPVAAQAAVRPAEPLPYSAGVAARFPEPSVRYETPGLETGRSTFTTQSEIGQWLRDIASKSLGSGTLLGLVTAGTSQRGETIHALVATRAGSIEPRALDALDRPTVLLVAQQRGDEPAGSEALLVVARELAPGGLLEPLLARINVVVVPRANPDGAASGQRSTANGIEMTHDHLLLRTPEARAIAALVRDYRPTVVVDAGEFDAAGPYLKKYQALQRPDVQLQYAGTANQHEIITKAAREWVQEPMSAALRDAQLSSDWYATTATDPQSMVMSMGSIAPDTLSNSNALRNALGLTVRTRGVGIGRAQLQRRVHGQVVAISSALRSTADRASELAQVQSFVRRDIASMACRQQMLVQAQQTPEQREVVMLQPETGADYTVRVDWNSSLALRPLASRVRPCGYWLAAEATQAAERLEQLGVQVLRVAEGAPLIADNFTPSPNAAMPAGGTVRRVQVIPTRGGIEAGPGSYYVPMNQPAAHLAAAALEPDTDFSFFAHHLIGNLGDVARVMAKPALVFEE